ncbi:MAG: hypothetical protein OXH79_07275 [Boseongicola sp.]|nr:hypothetical protein [Boseongicola sp.]
MLSIEEEQGLVSAMADDLRAALMAEIPDFGRHLGYDGKAIGSHSTGVEGRESGRISDRAGTDLPRRKKAWRAPKPAKESACRS